MNTAANEQLHLENNLDLAGPTGSSWSALAPSFGIGPLCQYLAAPGQWHALCLDKRQQAPPYADEYSKSELIMFRLMIIIIMLLVPDR